MTILTWVSMALLTLGAAAWMSRPWWQRLPQEAVRRRAVNVAAYRQRLSELDTEVDAGLISADAATRLRDELGARVVADSAEVRPESAGRRAPRAAVILGLLLAVFAAGYYYSAGSWRAQQQVAAGAGAAPATGEGQPAPLDDMVVALAKKLEAEPDNIEGWFMLGRSYFVMERYADAAKAYARVNDLSPSGNPDALVNEGEALALSRDRDLLGKPQQLFDQALAIAPDHGKALWYAGLAAEQAGDPARAKTLWTRLSAQELPEQLREVLATRLAALGGAAPAVAGGPALAAAPAAQPAAATADGVSLRIKLDIAPALAAKIPPGATLFVFARAENGPPMPLAVHRGPVGTFPVSITLDDSMAMMPALKISQFDRWTITARISRSGGAKPESGDLQGSRAVGREQAGAELPLSIDQVVP